MSNITNNSENSNNRSDDNSNELSIFNLVSKQTSNAKYLAFAKEVDTAYANKLFVIALNKANEAQLLAEKENNMPVGYCFYNIIGNILIELSLIDIQKAYSLGMQEKAREIAGKALLIADKSAAKIQRFITLMKLSELVKQYDVELAAKYDEELMEATIKGLLK